ncbi:DNA-directed RNA polymerase subunit omega [Clostridiales bacterium PH28_bin88]|nr:DNA-directed RNA polymerase subunit omega [Clostridiales bacterium PH28_bin88]
MRKVDSKYTLVVVAAKRARLLTENGTDFPDKSVKPVTIALHEMAKGKVQFERTKSGIK